jgi:hypothetical protein
MKTNKIPFDPKYIGHPEIEFETRCGYKAMFVRVSRFDKSKYIFEIDCPDRDVKVDSIAYGSDGINPGGNDIYDLFVVLPEPKLTKFQSAVLEVFENIITDYDLDISQSQESRLVYVERIRKAFIEELGIDCEEIQTLDFVLDNDVKGNENIKILEGLLQKLKEYRA